ncbi:hypothetical protein BKA70DRAFT_1375132 [Coprinopsis sp. MPI-PUGE-AT-0042]|nr:hypothetical protein BKA70DRAFT_1375132 [Coprinopsis sp. MPI-PUGE-AT-0042]
MGIGRRREAEPSGRRGRVRAAHAELQSGRRGAQRFKLVPATPRHKQKAAAQNSVPQSKRGQKSLLKATPKQDNTLQDQWEDVDTYMPYNSEVVVSQKNSSNDYMRQWLDKQDEYLDEIVSQQAAPSNAKCSRCALESPHALWRCKECVGCPLLCKSCCATDHIPLPLHRVEVWNKHHFSPSWLWKVGACVNLCATKTCQPLPSAISPSDDLPPEEEDHSSQWHTNDDFTFGADPKVRSIQGRKVLIVVHLNGVHYLPFHFCRCPGHVSDDLQLLRNGFYPATFKSIRTVFTFQLLDDYLLDILECHTSAFHYYSKLCRVTNKPFPHTVPNRARELRRVGRQWRKLKDLKRNGFAHKGQAPGKGDLALFCPCCPQPGVNLPDDWETDPDTWKYTRSFVADGNFTCVHRKQKNEGDIYLNQGECYLTEPKRYAQHLKETVEVKQKPTCNEHRAVADKSKVHKGCDVTGIGAIACMRHGCFVPGAVVDFQKGERQMNMDYAFTEAVNISCPDGIQKVILAYDINCQYSVHLKERIAKGQYLHIRDDLMLIYGIGLFHVHGHQDSCGHRYSLTYIRGAGMSSGEILESLWSVMNEAARTTSTMSLGHRQEVLDAVMGDSNWKKMINMIPTICKNWDNSRIQLSRAAEDFELLNETATVEQRAQWQGQLDAAHSKRKEDVAAMDILEVKVTKPPTLAKIQNDLMVDEQVTNTGLGVTTWLSAGIKLQETQYQLKSFKRNLPKGATELQTLELAQKREALQQEINVFYETAVTLFPGINFHELKCDMGPEETIEIEFEEADGYKDLEGDQDNPFSFAQNDVEEVALPLPSSFPAPLPKVMLDMRDKEIKLRVAQANDALELIRTSIGHKSFLYRSNVRLANGKRGKTRGYAAVNAVDRALRINISVYNKARLSLHRLNAPPSLQSQFRVLTHEDTKAITAIYDPNARGQRNVSLSWIWNMATPGATSSSVYIEELYRVNWLRARSRWERWKEEHELLRCEMEWALNFFAFKSDQCKVWALIRRDSPGHVAYARRQGEMWRLLGAQAESMFDSIRKSVDKI